MSHYLKIWNQLTKPRVSLLVLATVLPGLFLGGKEAPSLSLLGFTLFGTYLMGSASFIFNQYIERDKDAVMYRTKGRPIPSGLISPGQALGLGSITTILAFGILLYFVNLLTALCAFGALILYVFLYTLWLKPRTEQNIVIGGISGCVGPLIGYAAIQNQLPVPAWLLFFIIFLWTPAHFWALAIFLKDDYEYAGIPMMPVVSGIKKTVQQILIYSVLYSIACYSFYFVDSRMSYLFLGFVSILTIGIIGFAIHLLRNPEKTLAKQFFFFTILHLFLFNCTILLDSRI